MNHGTSKMCYLNDLVKNPGDLQHNWVGSKSTVNPNILNEPVFQGGGLSNANYRVASHVYLDANVQFI